MPRETFAQVVSAAIADIAEHGYDSQQRIDMWIAKLLNAARGQLMSPSAMQDLLRRSLTAKFNAALTASKKYHSGMDRFTLARVAPAARAELDRRIVASVSLIKLNREEATQKMVRRFVGWSTSVPPGGEDFIVDADGNTISKREQAKEIKKSLGQLSYVDRRLYIDQAAKMVANINTVIAEGGGAIAVEWQHVMQTAGYTPRPAHVAMNGNVYLLKSWASEKGLVKAGKYGWYEDTDQFAALPYCRCYGRYIYGLSRLPDDMITAAGRDVIAQAKRAIA